MILFEDKDMMVVEKPAGLLVYPLGNDRKEITLIDLLKGKLNFKHPNVRSGIVHRLDRETSGVLLVAKNEETESRLKNMFREREVEKTYTTLVWGILKPEKGEIKIPLGRASKDRLRVVPKENGRYSHTTYEVEKYYPKSNMTLVRVGLKTGRTHQIRVHFAAIGHPVVGDNKYTNKKTELKRQFLHATEIKFKHPYTGKLLVVRSPLSEDLKVFLKKVS